jgi:DNA repair exonuclease SbcCD ATPase subunit
MITLKSLRWSNLFSYGKDNYIDFTANQITQLIGKNGHGKSSIPLVLEETLYNKNSKGIKKADIINRYIKDKTYSAELTFDKDGDTYVVSISRSGATQSVNLTKNGTNVSGHTSTSTFKQIEDILGIDSKSFSQLVYQSSSSSLEFLTATDTNRKKFLIDLLNLSKYVEAFDVFKQAAKEVSEEVASLETMISTTETWIAKNSKVDTTTKSMEEVPTVDPAIKDEIIECCAKLENISATNKRIIKNEQYKKNLENIDLDLIKEAPPKPQDTSELSKGLGGLQKTVKDADLFISKVSNLSGMCPTCLQPINVEKLKELVAEQEELKKDAKTAISRIEAEISEHNSGKVRYSSYEKLKAEYEQYYGLIDSDLISIPLDEENLSSRISELKAKLLAQEASIKDIEKRNAEASSHNSKVSVILEQLESMGEDLKGYNEKLEKVGGKLVLLQMLQKTFSTNGLIAYKIECLVKDLEDLANTYLTELSDGRFQLTFKVSASDKLNVVVTDNGKDIDIVALSGGERARVNTATLLAIRKLMQSLSSARINLLILDETIDALDVDGKEKLIEVLLEEEHLNTFLVSHGFSHPLLGKITAIKENNVSRLEH